MLKIKIIIMHAANNVLVMPMPSGLNLKQIIPTSAVLPS